MPKLWKEEQMLKTLLKLTGMLLNRITKKASMNRHLKC